MNSQEKKDAYKQMMVNELCLLESDTLAEDDRGGPSGTQSKEKKRHFYEFNTDNDELTADDVEHEAVEYAKTLECLSKYPKIKQLFLKYSVMIPSSAPVERLFSLVLSSRCNRLTNGKFDICMYVTNIIATYIASYVYYIFRVCNYITSVKVTSPTLVALILK